MKVRIRITDGTLIRGEPAVPGQIVDVDAADALALVQCGRGVALDPAAVREALDECNTQTVATLRSAERQAARLRQVA